MTRCVLSTGIARVARRAAVGLIVLVVGGCASSSTWATHESVANLPRSVSTPTTTTTSAPPCNKDDLKYQPTLVPMPAAGAMPPGSAMARIQQRGSLRVGIDQNTPGFSERSADGTQIVGFEYDILHQIARAIFGDDDPSRIVPVALTTAQRLPAVESGDVDLAASLISHTCGRDRQVLFSNDYFLAHQDLLVPQNSPIKVATDVKGQRVCATKGSTSLANIVTLGAIPYPVASRADCLIALQDGRVDAVTSDDTVLAGFHQQDPTTKVLGVPLEAEHYGIAVANKNLDLIEFVNGVLASMSDPGCSASTCLSGLQRKWLTPLDITDPLPNNG
jgi:polar amino acid transport system substrate-binding protein